MSGKREGKRAEEKKNGKSVILTALLKGAVMGAAVLLLCLLAGAGGISLGMLGQEMMARWGILSCVAGGLTGGWMAVREERRMALILGPGTGGILFALLLLTGLVLGGGSPAGERMLPVLCACLCGGGMAGILGRKGKKRKKR